MVRDLLFGSIRSAQKKGGPAIATGAPFDAVPG